MTVMNKTSIKHLSRIRETLRIDDDAQAWLIEGFSRWLQANGQLQLTACLGISSKSKNVRAKMRDVYLIQAAKYLSGGPWELARNLQKEVRRFRNSRWPHWRRIEALPSTTTPIDRLLYLAFATSASIPDSLSGFYKILGNECGGTRLT
ncbi:MAG: hypothetical protein QM741_13200 [Rudaea sp.]|uniref:hypothetical protein n=1 Tax=Rudaea sp. TaxID=2136325 RepID=UPI0039E5C8B0